MSNPKVTATIRKVKQRADCRELFRNEFPDHYRSNGNSLCPWHDDQNPSLSLRKEGVYCFGSCAVNCKPKKYDVIAIVMKGRGIGFTDAVKLLEDRHGIKVDQPRNVIATYDYTDESGQLLFQVVRYEPKEFKQRRPDPHNPSNHVWKLGNTPRVLFQLLLILKAAPDEPILIVEGEKDALNAANLGFVATTNPQGAGKWKSQIEKDNIHQPLKDRIVWVIPDNDDPGRDHACDIVQSLHGFAKSVKILELPGLPDKADVSDFIQMHGPEKAKALLLGLGEKTPEYEPSQDKSGTEKPATGFGTAKKFKGLLLAFQQTGSEVFLDQHNSGWACIKVNDHYENISLHSASFARYLLKLYFSIYGEGVGAQVISQVADLLQATAEDHRTLYNRLAWIQDSLYIDLGTPSWEAIRVDHSGWEIVQVQRPPFKRFNHQQPLPVPQKEGDVREILEFLPLKDEKAKLLILAWIIAAFIENIPRPGIILHGLQGSGKSTVCEFLRDVIDPSSTPIVALSKDEPEFIQMMSHNAIVCLDNLHKLPQWASDDLCRAVTGSGFSKRQLYSDDDDIIYQFTRTFLLNGISVPGNSPDLMDRSILLELDRVKEENRRERGELCNGYKQARSRILGGILETLSRAMGLRSSIKLNRLPRMADFTVWGCAIAQALGFEQTDFLEAYYSNINFQHEEITTSEPVCMALIEFFKDREDWQGTAIDLCIDLCT